MANGNELTYLEPGSGVVTDERGTAADSGYITGWTDGVATVADLWAAGAAMPTTLPGGSGVPLVRQSKQLIGNGRAKIVGYYNRPSARFIPRVQTDPGSRIAQSVHDVAGELMPDPKAPGLFLTRNVERPIERISYFTRKYSYGDAKGTWSHTQKSKINNASFAIEDETYAAKSVRFEGFRLRHYKWGAYSIYDMRFDFLHDPLLWQYEQIDYETFTWSAVDEHEAVAFPTLPT